MKRIVKSNTQSIKADRFDDVWDQYKDLKQEFSSADTSINSGRLPAIFHLINLEPGTVNLDFGGGRFDNVATYYEKDGIMNLVFDPFNRTSEHNQEVIKKLREIGGADSATCSNVLNVIKEPENRLQVLKNIKSLIKPGAPVYITVYEGKGNGEEGPTKSGYQLNKKTKDYLEEIQEVFPDAKRKGNLIMASEITNKKSVSAAKTFESSGAYDYKGIGRFMVRFNRSEDPNLPGYTDIEISEIHPYDDADYAWVNYDASENRNYAYIIRDGKREDRLAISPWGDNEDMYDDIDEFRDDVINGLIDELRDSNKDVEPRMIHMSKDIAKRKKTVTASSKTPIMAADDDDFDVDDFSDVDTPDDTTPEEDEEISDQAPEVSGTDIDTDNNITDHYIAECEQCHGVFISSLKESEEGITSITGICPLCNKKTTQNLKWIVRDNDAPDDDIDDEVL